MWNARYHSAALAQEWRKNKILLLLALEAAEEFVEFVGGVEVGFEFAGGELFAQVVEATREQIECGRENFLIGKDDIAPRGIRAAR